MSTKEKEMFEKSEVEVQVTEEVIAKPKKKGTPPGWRPSGQLPKLKAPPGWHPKWSSISKLTERMSEGWKVMKPSDNHGDEIVNIDVNDVASLTGALRYRDLVAIMIPKELKAQRDEYIRNENKEAMRSVLRETDEKLKEGGVEVYAPKGQAGRVIIN
jgi:hypothetical protein